MRALLDPLYTLMDPAFAEMGSAYVTNMKSDAIIYWTQVFGTAR